MSGLVTILVSVLVLWMLACAWCGYHRRFVLFLAVVAVGLGLNWAWMIFGLNAHPFDPYALLTQISALAYAIASCGCGWLLGRFVRAWRDSRVEDAEV